MTGDEIADRSDAALRMINVTKVYRETVEDVWACRDINLSVRPRDLVWISGPSGAGKSTLLLAAALITPVDSGTICLGGIDGSALSEKHRANLRLKRLGVIFQDYMLIDSFTAEENVLLPLEAAGWPSGERRLEARRQLAVVGLDGLGVRRPEQLSGGQRQRVAIARALAGGKSLVLADEPTGSLDSRTSREIFGLLRRLADAGVAVVVASHDVECGEVADVRYDMVDGRIVRVA